MLKTYYRLTKPGIVYGNVLTTVAAFLFAARWHVDALLLVATVAGTALVIASACVCNNYLDRKIDAKMQRTSTRALVLGAVSTKRALIFAAVLLAVGEGLLGAVAGALTALIALFGFFMYVVVYGYAKRAGAWGTLVGSISGSVPIVIGYVAVTGHFDLVAALLFIILAVWQMPHFYAIALYRMEDYRTAGIPVLSVVRGVARTKRSIVWYLFAFVMATSSLTLFGFAGYTYLLVMLVVSLVWLRGALRGYKTQDPVPWGKRVFFHSLIALLVFSCALALAPLLP